MGDPKEREGRNPEQIPVSEPEGTPVPAKKTVRLETIVAVLAVITLIVGILTIFRKGPVPFLWGQVWGGGGVYLTEGGEVVRGNVANYYQALPETRWPSLGGDSLILKIAKAPLRVSSAGGFRVIAPRVSVSRQERLPVTISLINYQTGETAYQEEAEIHYEENTIQEIVIPGSTFAPETAYYYTVESQGYKTAISSEPFTFSPENETDTTLWPRLEALGAAFGRPFHVLLLDSDGTPVANADFSRGNKTSVEDERDINDPGRSTQAIISLATDRNGFLCWRGTLAEFQLAEGFSLKVKNADGSYVNAKLKYNAVDPEEPDLAIAVIDFIPD